MKASMFKMTAILTLGVFVVAPAMAFDICGNGYCCTTCIPDERLYCEEDCGPGVADPFEQANVLESSPVCSLESPVEAPADVVETAPAD